MMRSAVAYALHAGGFTNASDHWPFGSCEWKPSVGDPIRDLTKAGALIAAEIDRLQRLVGCATDSAEQASADSRAQRYQGRHDVEDQKGGMNLGASPRRS